MEEESIYNLIPKQYVAPPKEPRYKSKFPPNLPPTASTFGNHTTSRPGVSNVSGEFATPVVPHPATGMASTFGYPKGTRKPSPQNFRLKKTGTMGDNSLPDPRGYSYDCSHKKPAVPKPNERPVLGLKSNKNFIVTNAIENILSVPRAAKEETNWTKKKEYGKVPEYLNKIKDRIHNEYKMIQSLNADDNKEDKYCMSPQEVEELREGLKRRWEEVNKEYQTITHISKVDTIGMKRKKEGCERELAQLEQDIKKLNKMYVFVDKH